MLLCDPTLNMIKIIQKIEIFFWGGGGGGGWLECKQVHPNYEGQVYSLKGYNWY